MADQPETLELMWRDGIIPIATQFDDPYFSLHDGLAETQHVFLGGNDLPNRFKDGFSIAELGFGTGLNLAATWRIWRQYGMATQLQFTSFEMYPMKPLDMQKSLSLWPEVATEAKEIVAQLQQGSQRIETETLDARIIVGDARQTLNRWAGEADAWFLDGFSPAKNPQMWGADLMQAVADHTKPLGTFATYTAAGHVRQLLTNAGFEVERVQGFGRKRHMSKGWLRT